LLRRKLMPFGQKIGIITEEKRGKKWLYPKKLPGLNNPAST
jgi:hypothetical protein